MNEKRNPSIVRGGQGDTRKKEAGLLGGDRLAGGLANARVQFPEGGDSDSGPCQLWGG